MPKYTLDMVPSDMDIRKLDIQHNGTDQPILGVYLTPRADKYVFLGLSELTAIVQEMELLRLSNLLTGKK